MAAKRQKRPTRRARGTGTIQRQSDGSWIARTSDRSRSGRFPAGQAGYEEAEESLERWNKAIGFGRDPNDSRQSLRDFVYTWLADVVKPRTRPRTYEFYKRHAGYATAKIGDTALEAVGAQQIERMQSKLIDDGLSLRSADHVRAVLSNALGVAKRWGLIDENPAALVPRLSIPKRPERALTPVQVAILLKAVEGTRLECLYHIALTLGLRRGELLGLRWADVDWDKALLTVAQQVTEGEGRKIIIASYVKTDEGQRLLPLTADLLARLRRRQAEDAAEARHIQQRAAERAENRGQPIPLIQWNTGGLVFCSEVGTLIQPSNFNRRFAALVRSINDATPGALPADLHPHDMRHTALTDLAAHGEAKAVQSIAGHADIETTMNLYAGRRLTAMRAAVEAAEQGRKVG